MDSLMDRARASSSAEAESSASTSSGGQEVAAAASFEPKDPRQFVPPDMVDAVDRVVAAGMKVMYSPQMADERQAAIDGPDPVAKKLADNVTGLMLTLDQQAKGGIPEGAIFPAGVLLVNEAGQMLTQAGQTVTQEDYNEALQTLYVQLGKKLGLSDDQLMQGAQQGLEGGAAQPDVAAAATEPPPEEMPA